LSFDVAAFYNNYHLAYALPSGLVFEPFPVQTYAYTNNSSGSTFGVELLAQWLVTDRWRVAAGYNWIESDFGDEIVSILATPEHQLSLRSSLDLGHGWELNGAAYYVDRIQTLPQGTATISVPSYVRLDAGLVWRPTPNLELSVWGQNLLDDGHPEFASYKSSAVVQIPRTVYGGLTWRF
jgi:iron complex outermembrane receptor protein